MDIKKLWSKLDPKTAMIGGAIVVTTSLGTCQMTRKQQPSPAPIEVVVEEVEAEEPEAEEPEAIVEE
tara:strand:- start:18 stop:218 length:201 start_codon:yes stop_codon:yes gene_type:complete